ncbi:MAG TPA: NAD(P)/FAD-dependent oxidoreductase [Acetobacteraceae bacterium]
MAAWDILVIGGGAAGLSAAAAAAGLGLSCAVIDRMGGGGELMNLGPLHDIDEPLPGPDLTARLLEDAMTAGAALEVGEVSHLAQAGDLWRVTTDGGQHDARAVILAIGLAPGTLGLADEGDYEARGLSHCAACDGPLYRGDPVVVAGAGRWAVQEARDLAEIASAVSLVTQGGAVPASDGFTVIHGRIAGLEGTSGLDAVLVQPDDGTDMRRVATQAVFVQTGRRPAAGFAPHDLARDPDGRFVTDDTQQTNLPGLYAAGDARAGAERSLVFAMEDGRRAAVAACARLVPLGKSVG